MQNSQFSQVLIVWGRDHGRTGLPWQIKPTPYRVWVSEIMLQQTQVTTVIPYYERFMQRFPDVHALAKADQDEVMHHWSGLGYYARGRNLHKAASVIVEQYSGQFPGSFDDILALPGIGRSTAGAILSLAMGERYPILDGNAKRVFARYFAVEGWPGKPSIQKVLWQWADACLPDQEVGFYHQSLMDIGATLCSRKKPRCSDCPLVDDCLAYASGEPDRYPASKPKKIKPVKQVTMLILHNGRGELLLEARPPSGIWGGLWGLPEFQSIEEAKACAIQQSNSDGSRVSCWPVRRHTFTHFHLDIQPVAVECESLTDCVMETNRRVWYNTHSPEPLGLAAPVKQMIEVLQSQAEVTL